MTYVLDFNVDVLEWILSKSHPDPKVRERVNAKLNQALRYLAQYGPSVGEPHVRKIRGFPNLYEVRVEDGTGWYRVMFGLGHKDADGNTNVALAYAFVKHERTVPDRIHGMAAAAVEAHLKEIEK